MRAISFILCSKSCVTLQRGAFVSEPAVLMTRGGPGGQRIWNMDQFENKIIDLREIYAEWREHSNTLNLAVC